MQAKPEQPIDLAADLTPADRVLAIVGRIAFGTFRAKPSEPVFAGSSGLSCYYLVFPRTSSEIRLDRGPHGVVGPIDLAAYNPGDSYRRAMVSPEGDRSDYIAVDKRYMRDLLLSELGDLPPEASGDVLFRKMHAPQARSLFLGQRSFFERLIAQASAPAGSVPADRLELEEAGHRLILASLDSGIAGHLPRATGGSEPTASRPGRDGKAAACATLPRPPDAGRVGAWQRRLRRSPGAALPPPCRHVDPPVPDGTQAARLARASGRHAGQHH